MSRHHDGLTQLLARLEELQHPLVDLVRIIATAALTRTESRGGHWRADYPTQDPNQGVRNAWRLTPTPHRPGQRDRTHWTKDHLLHVDA